jgi:threonine efflux protein
MSYIFALAAFAGIHFLGMASPGASFVNTLRASTQYSRGVALFHALGLAGAAFVWALAAVLGLQSVLMTVPGLFRGLQLFGGVYLTWLAVNAWRHANVTAHQRASLELGATTTRFALFRRGLLTNLGNPKVMIFFASVFAAVLHPEWPIWIRFAAALLVFVDELTYYSSLTLVLSTRHAQQTYRHAKPIIDRVAGTALLLFALRLFYRALES